VHRLLLAANIPSSWILVTLMMEAVHSSEMSVLTRVTWHNILEDGILHSHHRENLKPYMTMKVHVHGNGEPSQYIKNIRI
jgi:hypothetical protein